MQPKLFTFTFLALSLGFASSLRAQSSDVTPGSSIDEIERALDGSIFKMKVETEVDPVGTLFDRTTKIVDIWINKTEGGPGGCHVRGRMQSAVDEMVARARRAGLHFLEVEQFQEQVIEARLDVALDELQVEMIGGRLSPGRYERMTTLIQQRAEAALEDTSAPMVRARLQSALDDLFATARTAVERQTKFSRFYATLVDARFARALGWLQFHAAAREATRQEYDRVQAILIERAEAQKGNVPQPCS
jgi:hypothetical protein